MARLKQRLAPAFCKQTYIYNIINITKQSKTVTFHRATLDATFNNTHPQYQSANICLHLRAANRYSALMYSVCNYPCLPFSGPIMTCASSAPRGAARNFGPHEKENTYLYFLMISICFSIFWSPCQSGALRIFLASPT